MEAARPAGPEDLPRLVELARQAVAELAVQRGGRVWRRREARLEPVEEDLATAIATSQEGEGGRVVVGTIDSVPVGYGVARREALPEGGWLGVVEDLYVEPGARGVGIGEAMMDLVVDWARSTGCIGIDAMALPGARETKNFFERFGLVARAIVVHRSFTGEEPAVDPPAPGPR